MTNHPPLTIAIAGAGLVGRLLAWRLLESGHKVSLFEKGSLQNSQSAAHTAAAMISPLSEVVVSERAIYDMGIQSLALWPAWIDALETQQPSITPLGYQANGSLAIAHPSDLGELQQFYQDLNYQLGADNNARWVEGNELQTLEPSLSRQFQAGLFLPNEAHLDNRALLNTLLQRINSLGGICRENAPIEFTPAATLNNEPLKSYDLIIDARGVGAKLDNSPKPSPLRGVRGEVLWVETDEVKLARPIRLMHPRYKLYIVPKPNNQFIIGATEIESEDTSPATVQSMMELCSALYTLNPAFAEARICELDANLRPSYLDNLPGISHSEPKNTDDSSTQILHINGLYRHGYLLAPYLVQKAEADINDLFSKTTNE